MSDEAAAERKSSQGECQTHLRIVQVRDVLVYERDQAFQVLDRDLWRKQPMRSARNEPTAHTWRAKSVMGSAGKSTQARPAMGQHWAYEARTEGHWRSKK